MAVPVQQETRVIDGVTYLRVEPDTAYIPMPRCRFCRYWDCVDTPPYRSDDIGLCQSKDVRRTVEQISTSPDFGCVYFQAKP